MKKVIGLIVDRVDLVDEGCNSEAHILMYKRREQISMTYEEIIAKLKPEERKAIEAEVTKAKEEIPAQTVLDLAKAKQDHAESELVVLKYKEAEKTTETEEEIMLKNASPEFAKAYRAMAKAKEDAEEVVRKSKEEAIQVEAVAKAKTLEHISAEESVLVDMYKKAPEFFEILEKTNKAIEDGIFKAKGSNEDGKELEGETAEDKLNAVAKKLVADEGMSYSEAFKKARKDNPEVAKQYYEEVKVDA